MTKRKQPALVVCHDGKRCKGTHPLICRDNGCGILVGRARKTMNKKRNSKAAETAFAKLVKCREVLKSPCSALADVALEVCREQQAGSVWYGNPQLCQDIYSRWGGKHTHALNTIATVVSACARSKKWKRTGYITHLGRRYPLYSPNAKSSD